MSERDDEQFVEGALSKLPPAVPSAALLRRVAQIPITHPRRRNSLFMPPQQWALGLAAAALIGVVGGWFTLDGEAVNGAVADAEVGARVQSPGAADSVANTQFVDEETEDLDSMFALAWGGEDEAFGDEW